MQISDGSVFTKSRINSGEGGGASGELWGLKEEHTLLSWPWHCCQELRHWGQAVPQRSMVTLPYRCSVSQKEDQQPWGKDPSQVLLCFIPLHAFPLVFFPSWFISHFLLERPIPTASSEQPAVLIAELFVSGRQRGWNIQFILISMAWISGELH